MARVHLWAVLGSSAYPQDEGQLPARVHIRRALGGPATSFVFGLAAAGLAAILFPLGGLARYLSLFLALDNFTLYALGSLVSLGPRDGSALLR